MKLSKDSSEKNTEAQTKALEVVKSISSQSLILEAHLFGSAVTGVFTPDSDLDILVVVKEGSDIRSLMTEVYKIRFSDIAIDWIFKTRDEFESRKNFGGVCFEAYHFGKRLK